MLVARPRATKRDVLGTCAAPARGISVYRGLYVVVHMPGSPWATLGCISEALLFLDVPGDLLSILAVVLLWNHWPKMEALDGA